MTVSGFVDREVLRRLDEARQMLESGQVEAARSLATAVLKAAEAQDDRAAQGQALMALSQFDRVLGRFRRAIDTAHRAAQLFQHDGDIAGEASALSLLAHANSYLGRDEEAVEAALLSVKLGDLLPPGALQVNLYNYLGVAYLWASSLASAESAFREAERLASQGGAASVLLPRINLAWLEALRLFKERYFSGVLPGTDELRRRLALCSALFDDDVPFPGLPGVRSVLQRFGRCAQVLLLCWSGELERAAEQLLAVQDRLGPGNYAQVANFFGHWAAAELHLARLDLGAAEREATLLVDKATQAEYEQMAYIGHFLLTQIHIRQGQYARALEESSAHRRRELRVQADILESRHKIVQTQLDIRRSEHHLQQLVRHAQELERLSYEDSLTALSNRRRFEVQLASALGGGWDEQHPVCVAIIDVDGFKRINDSYTHAAGDDVLKTVAQAIRESVRESDLPARLGGDEFVILFQHTGLEVARQVCERLHAALARLRWAHLSAALRVSVSIGVCEAEPGDTPASLLRRSDSAMFRAKAGASGEAGAKSDASVASMPSRP
ncbi:MAG: GGDEF domain-containing protein [Caldimonas sp.]